MGWLLLHHAFLHATRGYQCTAQPAAAGSSQAVPSCLALLRCCLLCCGAQMLEHCSTRFRLKFTAYDQSSKAVTQADSSVSYAAAVMVPAPTNGQEA